MAAGPMMPTGNGRRARRSRYRPMSEINVTPFVDVMLVLLIVFMVTAPLLTVGVPVDLPRTQAGNVPAEDEPLVISVTRQGEVFIQETPVDLQNLVDLLVAITDANRDTRIFLRGDEAINYGRVMQVMGALNTAGFTQVALVAELPTPGER